MVYEHKSKIPFVEDTDSNINSNFYLHSFTGLSLRAGGRGFSPATRSLNPGYFDTERKYWKEKNASNYKIMNYKTNQYFINTNSYSSFKVR